MPGDANLPGLGDYRCLEGGLLAKVAQGGPRWPRWVVGCHGYDERLPGCTASSLERRPHPLVPTYLALRHLCVPPRAPPRRTPPHPTSGTPPLSPSPPQPSLPTINRLSPSHHKCRSQRPLDPPSVPLLDALRGPAIWLLFFGQAHARRWGEGCAERAVDTPSLFSTHFKNALILELWILFSGYGWILRAVQIFTFGFELLTSLVFFYNASRMHDTSRFPSISPQKSFSNSNHYLFIGKN